MQYSRTCWKSNFLLLVLTWVVPQVCHASLLDDGVRQQIKIILDAIGSWKTIQETQERKQPFVTLTFAQSLDGKIALVNDGTTLPSSNFRLSGDASLLMTHGLRSIHDAIIVGGQTFSTDNPRLSNRLWGDDQPRPVVLDTSLRHLRRLEGTIRARNLIVCCSQEAADSYSSNELPSVQILPCRLNSDSSLDLCHVLEQLKTTFGIRSVMVEGGAGVLSSFVSANLGDCICITIAPKLIGNKDGIAAFASIAFRPFLDFGESGNFLPLGSDCIYLSRWPHRE